jgi:nucleoside-diphosphate-sugar epimerase
MQCISIGNGVSGLSQNEPRSGNRVGPRSSQAAVEPGRRRVRLRSNWAAVELGCDRTRPRSNRAARRDRTAIHGQGKEHRTDDEMASEQMTRRRVLLAGAGDLCLRAGRLLAQRGDEIWALRRRPPADDSAGLRWLAGDLTQKLHGLPPGITHVVYAPAPDLRDAQAYRAVFELGPRNLLAALDCAALQRLVFISSSAVYGDHGGAWVDEDTPACPAGFNGSILLEAEGWLRDRLDCATSLRLAGLYGPGRLALLRRIASGSARVPRGTGHWANRIHIEDAARAVVHVLDLPQARDCYIGTDDTPQLIEDLYDALAQMLGAPSPPAGPLPAGMGSKRLSNTRLRASGFVPAWPDAIQGYQGLIETADW